MELNSLIKNLKNKKVRLCWHAKYYNEAQAIKTNRLVIKYLQYLRITNLKLHYSLTAVMAQSLGPKLTNKPISLNNFTDFYNKWKICY